MSHVIRAFGILLVSNSFITSTNGRDNTDDNSERATVASTTTVQRSIPTTGNRQVNSLASPTSIQTTLTADRTSRATGSVQVNSATRSTNIPTTRTADRTSRATGSVQVNSATRSTSILPTTKEVQYPPNTGQPFHVHISTPPIYGYYMCFPSATYTNMYLQFRVKTCHDAIIHVFSENEITYKIVIGAKNNTGVFIQQVHQYKVTVLNATRGEFVNCTEYKKFKIFWNDEYLLFESKTILLRTHVPKKHHPWYATISTGLGASGDWEFLFHREGNFDSRPHIVNIKDQTENVLFCPALPTCDFDMEIDSTCDPIVLDTGPDCKTNESGSYMYLQITCAATKDIEVTCTTEIIELLGCISTSENCEQCKITNYTIDTPLRVCHGDKHEQVMVYVTMVNACDFINNGNWKWYFRLVHFMSVDDASTAAPTQSSTQITGAESLQNSNAPLTTGIVIGATGILVAVVCAVILVIFIRRSRMIEHKRSTHNTVPTGDDYTGNQSVALPSGGHVPNSDKYTDIQLEMEDQSYQELTIQSKSENEVSYDYIDTTDEKRKSEPKTNKESKKSEYVKQVKDLLDYPPKTDGNNYSLLDPDETGFHGTHELQKIATETEASSAYAVLDPTVTGFDRCAIQPVQPVDTCAILDPSETGYNRQEEASHGQSEYEMAKPLTDDKIGEIQEQPYCSDYNKPGDSILQKVEENVYSHSVDNVYDCASHNSKSKESDGTYDHFVGQ